MSGWRGVGLAVLVAAPFLLAGCSSSPHAGKPDVDFDTPALRTLKKDAGVPDCPLPTATTPATTKALPHATLPCLGGGHSVDLSRLRGPMVINLWAQWCEPCRDEMPVLQKFHEKYGKRMPIIGVDWEDFQPKLALELAQKSGVTYPLVADPDKKVRASALPTTILIDKDGHVVFQEATVIGRVLDLEALVRENLGIDLTGKTTKP